MTRTPLSARLAAVAACALIAGAAQAEKIVISNWDGYMPPDLLENFTKETGIEAELSVHATNEEIMGKVVAGGGKGYDVLFVSSPFAEALKNLGLSAPIDHDKVPNLENLYDEATELAHDPGNTYSVPYAWGTTGLCYRSDMMEEPTSWNALLSPSDDLKGKVTMLSTDRWLMGAAALALGKSLNDTSAETLAAEKDMLIATKQDLLAYDDATFYLKLVSGEATMVQAWDGWCNYGIAENAEIKYTIPEEGSDLWVDAIVITNASENKDAAHAFVNYVMGKDVGVWVASNILYKTPNQAAMEALDPSLVESFPNMGMAPAELVKYEQLRDLGQGQKAFARTVTEIMAAQ
ncbi:polyamine ABC transporter substrate-binding protein [Arenibacterium halophilum]|uniref:Putrescine-binding periplasmic protein n=1 Tax=Arenibacterium halophilum TaxID=2583821 RepID=A0ABY2XFR5_9RHOB|nr:spermidine/putrescine ABC transporter substrate-binding protein [Arenibacterium halophilum]TMV15476.1 spermidine/putrescine ABC transporter substrate-binding protein [Arenibacterium halophilum]